jgi:hypothetical protein
VLLTPPEFSLVDLAALVDHCDVFVSGDTGPLHIAAARKHVVGTGTELRNRTSIVNVFKATDPRIYGYDSARPDLIDAGQEAPATVFSAEPPCKRLSCSLQRITASCAATLCQGELDGREVAASILEALERWRPGRGWPRELPLAS